MTDTAHAHGSAATSAAVSVAELVTRLGASPAAAPRLPGARRATSAAMAGSGPSVAELVRREAGAAHQPVSRAQPPTTALLRVRGPQLGRLTATGVLLSATLTGSAALFGGGELPPRGDVPEGPTRSSPQLAVPPPAAPGQALPPNSPAALAVDSTARDGAVSGAAGGVASVPSDAAGTPGPPSSSTAGGAAAPPGPSGPPTATDDGPPADDPGSGTGGDGGSEHPGGPAPPTGPRTDGGESTEPGRPDQDGHDSGESGGRHDPGDDGFGSDESEDGHGVGSGRSHGPGSDSGRQRPHNDSEGTDSAGSPDSAASERPTERHRGGEHPYA